MPDSPCDLGMFSSRMDGGWPEVQECLLNKQPLGVLLLLGRGVCWRQDFSSALAPRLRSRAWIQPREVRRGLELHKAGMVSMWMSWEPGPVQHPEHLALRVGLDHL